MLNFHLNMLSNRLAGSAVDGSALFCKRRHVICICFYIYGETQGENVEHRNGINSKLAGVSEGEWLVHGNTHTTAPKLLLDPMPLSASFLKI